MVTLLKVSVVSPVSIDSHKARLLKSIAEESVTSETKEILITMRLIMQI